MAPGSRKTVFNLPVVRFSGISRHSRGRSTYLPILRAGVIRDEFQLSAIKRYLSKLHPDENRLFQRALSGEMSAAANCWFMKMPLSHNILSGMMKRLSSDALLSMQYTNHCVRATSITNMKKCGVDDWRICSVSGHRNVQSLTAYDRPNLTESCSMAEAIDLRLPVADKSNHAVQSSTPAVTVQSHSSAVQSSASAVSPYLNAASTTFKHSSIVFNIHAERAVEARKKLKRTHSAK
eukprot:scpid85977/ scgid27256/ 